MMILDPDSKNILEHLKLQDNINQQTLPLEIKSCGEITHGEHRCILRSRDITTSGSITKRAKPSYQKHTTMIVMPSFISVYWQAD